MRRIGYVKAKTPEQIEKQKKELIFFGANEFIVNKGPVIFRSLSRGDIVHITELNRLSRNVTEAARILEDLHSHGVRLYVGAKEYDLEKFKLYSDVIDQLSAK